MDELQIKWPWEMIWIEYADEIIAQIKEALPPDHEIQKHDIFPAIKWERRLIFIVDDETTGNRILMNFEKMKRWKNTKFKEPIYEEPQKLYWQDKSQREVDFVIRRGRDTVDALECKINPDRLETKSFTAFRDLYPAGDNYLVSPGVKKPYRIRRANMVSMLFSPQDLPV